MAALATILHGMLGRAIRMEGFCGLMAENCKACSSYPNEMEPLKRELDAIVRTVTDLIDCFDKEANK